jgi:hypothetical protein
MDGVERVGPRAACLVRELRAWLSLIKKSWKEVGESFLLPKFKINNAAVSH